MGLYKINDWGEFMYSECTKDELIARIQSLEEENHFYKCLMDAFPVNVFVKDTDCRYAITSRVCDELNGVERGGLKGKTDFDIQGSRDVAQNFYEDDQQILRDKVGSRMFSPAVCGDAVKYFDIFKEPILDEDGNMLGILGMVVDPGEAILTSDKEKSDTINYINDYKYENNLMFDYNLVTSETMILVKPEEFDFLPNHMDSFSDYIEEHGYLDSENANKIKRLFDKIRNGKNQCGGVIQFYNDNGDSKYALVNVNALYGKDGKASRVMCFIRSIDEIAAHSEMRKHIIKDVSARFNNILSDAYEKIIYASPGRNWYHVIKNSTGDMLEASGTYMNLKNVWQSVVSEKEWQQFNEMYADSDFKRNETRQGVTLFRTRSNAGSDDYRWKEVTIFSQASEDDDKSYIVAIADIEDDVREENRVRRHDTNRQIIDVLSTIVEYRDLESGEHIKRIEELSAILLREYSKIYTNSGFSDEEIKIISAAAAMHDIGKIAISDSILLKPGKLTKEEYDNMKEHTVKGSELVRTVASIQDRDYARYCYEICRYHHERYDGNGYPEGLSGDDIPIAAQIVSIVDVYDALVSKRCYKDAYAKEKAYEMIKNGECGIFSDKIMN